jgi:hypothetical protein
MTGLDMAFRSLPLVGAVLMVGWTIAFLHADAQVSECRDNVQMRIERANARMDANKSTIDRMNRSGGPASNQP